MPATSRPREPRHLIVALTVLSALGLCGCREAATTVYEGVSAVAADYETRYAPGYSEEKFREVAVGQSREDVRTRLGEPLRKWKTLAGERWAYSESPNSGDFWVRQVAFDQRGQVEQIHAELYVD